MGNIEAKPDFKAAVLELTAKHAKVDDGAFWDRFWATANAQTAKDLFAMVSAADIVDLKNNSPSNLATLIYKAVECLQKCRDSSVPAFDHKKVGID